PPPISPLFPYTTLFRSRLSVAPISPRKTDLVILLSREFCNGLPKPGKMIGQKFRARERALLMHCAKLPKIRFPPGELMQLFWSRSEEHTSELQSLAYLV